MRAAFYRWLDRLPDGRWILRLDEHRYAYLDVEDTPYVVRSLRWEGDRAVARLSDDTEEPLDAASVRLRPGGGADTRVKPGRFPARFSTAAFAVLGERIEDRDGRPVLQAAGGPHPLD